MGNPTVESISNLVGGIASTYDADRVVLLGKGPSADKVDRALFADAVVIGINDAERIVPVDITIFHEERFRDSIITNGAQSKLYLTSVEFEPQHGRVVQVPYKPLENDSADLMMSRFIDTSDVVSVRSSERTVRHTRRKPSRRSPSTSISPVT